MINLCSIIFGQDVAINRIIGSILVVAGFIVSDIAISLLVQNIILGIFISSCIGTGISIITFGYIVFSGGD